MRCESNVMSKCMHATLSPLDINKFKYNNLRIATLFAYCPSFFCLVLHMSILLSFYAKLTSIESSFWAYFAYCCNNRHWHAHFKLRHFQFQSSLLLPGRLNDTFPNLEQYNFILINCKMIYCQMCAIFSIFDVLPFSRDGHSTFFNYF